MKLSNFDFFLEWNELKALLGNIKQETFAIHDIQPSGTSVSVDGETSVKGRRIVWSVCVEPAASKNGKCLVVLVKSLRLKPWWIRFGFKTVKNLWFFNWTRSSEEFAVRMVVEICSKRFDGLRAKGNRLMVDPVSLLSAVLKQTDPPVQIGKITRFGSDETGIRLVVESA